MIFGNLFFVLLFLKLVCNHSNMNDCNNESANRLPANTQQISSNDTSNTYLYQELDTLSQIEKYLPYINAENIFRQGKNLFFEEGVKNLFPLEWNIRNLSFSSKFAFFQLVQGDDFNDSREILFSKYKISKNVLILYDLVRVDKYKFKHTIYQFYRISENEFIANSFMLIYRIKISEDGKGYSIKEKSLTNPYSVNGLQVIQPSNMKYNDDHLLIVSGRTIFLYRLGEDKITDVTDYLIRFKYVDKDRTKAFTVLNANNNDFVIIYRENFAFRVRVRGENFDVTPINIEKFKQFPGKDNFEYIFDYSSEGLLELWRQDGLILCLNVDNQSNFSQQKYDIPFDSYNFLKINTNLQLVYSASAIFFRKLVKKNNVSKPQTRLDETDNFGEGTSVILGYTYGIAVADIDNDDKEEILCIEPSATNKLLKYDISTGNYLEIKGRFPEHSSVDAFNDLGGKFVDINNDGYEDLVLSTMDNGGGLFLNNGNGYFRDVTSEYGLDSIFNRSESVTIADLNNDGWVDLFVTNFYGTNRLLINTNGTEFKDETINYGLESSGNSINAAVGDINNDGFTDLYVVGWNCSGILYLNMKSSFTDVTSKFGLNTDSTLLANSVLLADFNNDTFMDVFLSYRATASKLFINQRGHGFTEASELLEENITSTTYGTVAADFNNDLRTDIAINSSNNTYIYYNECDSVSKYGFRFLKKSLYSSKSTINPLRGYGTGLGVSDTDGDGDLDLIVGQFKGLTILYKNLSSENNKNQSKCINVKVHTNRTNYSFLGVKILGITKDSIYYFREIGTGEGYCSQISNMLIVPVLPNNPDCKIKVIFPVSGDTVYADIKNNNSSLDIYEKSNGLYELKRIILTTAEFIVRKEIFVKIGVIFVLSLICFFILDYDFKNYKLFIKEYNLSFVHFIPIVSVAFILSQTIVELTKDDNQSNALWRDHIDGRTEIFLLPLLFTTTLTLTYFKTRDYFSWKKITRKPDIARLNRLLYMFDHGEGRKSNLSSVALLLTNVRYFVSEGEITNPLMLDMLKNKLIEFRHLTLPAIREILLTLSFLRSKNAKLLNYKDFQTLNKVTFTIMQSTDDLSNALEREERKRIVYEARNIVGLISKLNSILYKIRHKSTEFTKISLTDLLSKIADSTDKTKSVGINLIIEKPVEDIKLYTDAVKLTECIENIIKNSVESFYNSVYSTKDIILKVDNSMERLLIIIEDNGSGIPESSMKNLFKNGFSTKGIKRGKGLVFVREMLIELGGEIDIISREYIGTKVIITFNKKNKE